MVDKLLRQNAVKSQTMTKVATSNFLGCYFGHWASSIQLKISVDNDMYLLITLCILKKSHDGHCDKVEWSRYLKKQHVTPVVVLGFVSCTIWICAYNLVDVSCHVRTVKGAR